MSVPILVALAACSLFPSCLLRSAHPWFNEDDVVFERELLGGWVGPDENNPLAMTLVQADPNRYTVQYSSRDGQGVFEARLARLAGTYFMDFRPADEAPGLHGVLFLPTHSVARIEWEKDNLRLYLFNYDAVKDAARQGSLRELEYEWTEEGKELLVVSRPDELRRFLMGHAFDPSLFADPILLTRKK
ncbi:MAG: hypothetical protein HYY26_02790 [Acidobacteria bacterium]|nr:hypothetical protein [Acidobacteriota bacterium]